MSLLTSDVERQILLLQKCATIKESEATNLCFAAKEVLSSEPNVLRLQPPIVVCGDVHGQFFDVVELFKVGGSLPYTDYVFLGDYVDRGHYSIETFLFLLAQKVRYPTRLRLLRGNHECRQITQVYGFDKILCVHGGLSPSAPDIATIERADRIREIPHDGVVCDLLWSDPEQSIREWGISPRGAGYLFGPDVTNTFCHNNGIELICRAHQLVMEGFQLVFGGAHQVATIWSAPNYIYRCGNDACILVLDEGLRKSWVCFGPAPPEERVPCREGAELKVPEHFV